MRRIDQEFFALFAPVWSMLCKIFGVAIIVVILLLPPAIVYNQSIRNHAVIENNKSISKSIDDKVQNIVDDLEVRKQIRVDLFKQLDEIHENLKNKDKHLDIIEKKIDAMDCSKCHCYKTKE